jgi:surface antigen
MNPLPQLMRVNVGGGGIERSFSRRLGSMCPRRSLVALFLLACVGCAESPSGPKEFGGVVFGGALGGLAGAQLGKGTGQLAATAAGTLLGALLGSDVGRSLDRADRLAMEHATQQTLERVPSGRTATWRNTETGHSGTIKPTRSFSQAGGQLCREYQQTILVGGQMQEAYGTACRQPDGTRQIVA